MHLNALDKGYAWVVVSCGLLIKCMVTGCLSFYGVIYLELQAYFGTSKSAVSVILAITTITSGCAGMFHGALIGRFGSRSVGLVCCIIVTSSLLFSVISQKIWHLYLSYGVLLGLGISSYTTVSVTSVCEWFDEKRTLAVSLVMIGAPLASFIWPPIVTELVSFYSWRGAMMIFAGIHLQVLVLFALLRPIKPHCRITKKFCNDESDKRQSQAPNASVDVSSDSTEEFREKSSKRENQVDATADDSKCSDSVAAWLCLFKDPLFLVFLCGHFLINIGDGMPFGYLVPRAVLLGYSANKAALLASVFGLVGLVSRLMIGLIGTYTGVKCRLYATGVSAISSGLFGLLSMLSASYWYHMTLSVLYGASTAVYGVYSVNSIPDLFAKSALSERLGLVQTVSFIGYLLGGLLTGFIWDSTNIPSLPFAVCGGLEVVGGVCLLACMVVYLGRKQGR